MPGGKNFYAIMAVVIAIPVVIFAWWLVSPLFLGKTVDESFPLTANAVMPEDMTRAEAEKMMSEAAAMPVKTVAEAMPAAPGAPARLKGGEFRDGDSFHKGSGQAIVYELPGGSRLLRLENFDVTNGPDLRVILTTAADPANAGDVRAPGHVELDKLKGNSGNQNYPIPADADIDSFQSVVIFCNPFRVIFSVAPLS